MNHLLRHFFCCFSFTLLFYLNLIGQLTISGSVLNVQSTPLPYANIVLLNEVDSTFVGGTTTNEMGYFELMADESVSNYILAIHLLGFKSSFVLVSFEKNSEILIPPITLLEDAIALNTVKVTAEKPLMVQSIDRTIVNLENRIAKEGTTVLDLLEKLPGILVDRQNESIRLIGKDGLNLLINGRQQYLTEAALFNYLSGLNADNLSVVELITTPPANFDAQGNAGFINLQLKQYPGDGFNGSYALTAGYGNGEVVNGNLNFNYRKKPFALTANYSFAHSGQGQFSTMDRRVGTGESFLATNTYLERNPSVNSHNLHLVTDYQLNEKTSIGSVLTAYARFWNMDATYDISFQPEDGLDTLVDATLVEENDWKSIQGNLNFNHKLNERTTISADFDYLWFDNVNPNDYEFNYQLDDGSALPGFNLVSDKETPFIIRVGRVDFQNQVSPKVKWSAGLKSSFSTFENDIRALRNQTILPAFTSVSNLQEWVSAIYAQFDVDLSKKVQFKGGLRYEYSDTNLSDSEGALLVDREFGEFFPTLYVKFGAFNLSFGKRINRPSFRAMAPFQFFVGPNTSNGGNPALQPAISHNLSANYRWKTINFNVQYTREDSSIVFFQNRFDPNTNIQTILPSNLQKEEYIAFSISSPVNLTKWWTLRLFADYFYLEAVTLDELGILKLNQNGYSANIHQVLSFAKNWTFETSAFYRSIGLNGNVRIQPYGGLKIGLQKRLKNGAQLTFSLSDLLETIQNKGITDLPNENIFVAQLSDFSNRTISISYRHSFGNKNVEKTREIKQAEERKRVQ